MKPLYLRRIAQQCKEGQGREMLTQILQVREEKILLDNELEKKRKKEEEEEAKRMTGELQCLTCHITFSVREEQVEHYRLDWHRHNLKRRLKGLPPLSQDKFEYQSDAGDLSSISGSESDSDGDEDNEMGVANHGVLQQGSPLLVFTTPDGISHAIYRCLVMNSKDSRTISEMSQQLMVELVSSPPRVWVVLMRSGGHFAGAVFRGSSVVSHKTFHRYTVRAKQGTVQSSRDSHHGGHKPRSAGASLRRYNEAALEQEICDLLLSWKQHISDASLIFIRAPKHNRMMFTSGKDTPLNPDDPRIRGIPFMTRRPTFSELKSVVLKLSTIHSGVQCPQPQTTSKTQPHSKTNESTVDPRTNNGSVACNKESPDLYIDKVSNWRLSSLTESEEDEKTATNKSTIKKKKRARKKKQVAKEEEVDPVIKRLHELINKGDITGVQSLLDVTSQSAPPSCDINVLHEGNTALHVAAAGGQGDLVFLLMSHGADPTIRNSAHKFPYLLSKDKPTRDSFRRFMSRHPTAFDYALAQIPAPLTDEMEESRKEKKNEKKKAQKKAQKLRKKEKAEEEEMSRMEKEREGVVRTLSDRERRAMAAEKRLATQLPQAGKDITKYGNCSWCGASLCGVVAFERLNYKYCKIECVRDHRKKLQRTD